jgi:hypothetical protein
MEIERWDVDAVTFMEDYRIFTLNFIVKRIGKVVWLEEVHR